MGLVDLHAHLLPWLDDGPDSLDDALAMLREYVRQGVSDVVSTPHMSWDRGQARSEGMLLSARVHRVREIRETLEEEARRQGLRIRLHDGLECVVGQDLLDALGDPGLAPRLALGQSRYLLVETPPWLAGGLSTLEVLLYEIQLAGFLPILAHPERLMQDHSVGPTLQKWIGRDRLRLQVNASALSPLSLYPKERRGRYEIRQGHAAWLMRRELVHIVASDAHDPVIRPIHLEASHAFISARYGPESADRLLKRNPAQVLSDGPL